MVSSTYAAYHVHIQGIVQGVGFRPFVYNLAQKHNLFGWVKNTSSGVYIEVSGPHQELEEFLREIKTAPPPLASIDKFEISTIPVPQHTKFHIVASSSQPDEFIPISPDVSICDDCLKELFTPLNRRHLYPFINCTNCGPRYTIIKNIPYDRPYTTMAQFEMCQDCHSEYTDPANRRFHAQPIACPNCGPHVWLEFPSNSITTATQTVTGDSAAVAATKELLASGSIIAIKGLGGFHLACNAVDESAVRTLRERKLRVDKPFAVMMPDSVTVEKHCYLSPKTRAILESKERPIVILDRKPGSNISRSISPNQDTIGVMLPYTPLHYLLLHQGNAPDQEPCFEALVMTSGNISEEPIVYQNKDGRERLSNLADAFLMHNRDIYIRCDDSVGRNIELNTSSGQFDSDPFIISRRARGYAPKPIVLDWESLPVLAVGAALKNTICLTRNQYAFLSHYIGDMHNYETYVSFEKAIHHLKKIFNINPEVIAFDAHPDYLSTHFAEQWAKENSKIGVKIQHHHAHVASLMAEKQRPDQPVIGIAFDGTGYGDDGCIWGGEFLISTYHDYQRKYQIEYLPLPGGDQAIKQPARIALAYLWKLGIPWSPEIASCDYFCAQDQFALKSQLENQINTPQTSSMGRLFDAVSSLLGICHNVNYEAQAAIELEAIADPLEESAYPYYLDKNSIRISPMINEILHQLLSGVPVSKISARFHNTIVEMVVEIVTKISEETAIDTVALSGGVWQNIRLLEGSVEKLDSLGYQVLFHQMIPTNDSGIALGQAAIAHHSYQKAR